MAELNHLKRMQEHQLISTVVVRPLGQALLQVNHPQIQIDHWALVASPLISGRYQRSLKYYLQDQFQIDHLKLDMASLGKSRAALT
jgi:hypothetical protein